MLWPSQQKCFWEFPARLLNNKNSFAIETLLTQVLVCQYFSDYFDKTDYYSADQFQHFKNLRPNSSWHMAERSGGHAAN